MNVSNRERPTRLTIFIHYLWIGLALVCFVSGYIAFDGSWSGVGLLNRPVYFAAHQTSGSLFLLVSACGLGRLLMRGIKRYEGQKWIDLLAGLFHRLLLIGFVVAAALAVWGTACGGYPFHVFGSVRIPLSLSEPSCFAPVQLFDFHKTVSNWLLIAVLLHISAAAIHLLARRDSRVQSFFSLRR